MMEMNFKSKGRNVILRGLSRDAPKVVMAKRIERIYRNNGVDWVVQCLVLTKNSEDG